MVQVCPLSSTLIDHTGLSAYYFGMSYRTLEVELENGRVQPLSAETLPEKAHALLTILDLNGCGDTPKGTLADRVADLAGIGRGDFNDLSSNKAHLSDMGR